MHRDLKGANLLVNNRGELKITDFGLARPIEENRLKYTPGVVTRWYRPPELLFGSEVYTESVDIWGAGCIIAEMYIRKPLFGASSDLEQLKTVCIYCGTPTEENFPGVSELPDFSKIQLKPEKRILKEYLKSKKLDSAAVDLIDKMLVLDPKQRISAQEALEHEYFKCEPFPCLPSEIGQFESSHVYTVQKQKEKEQQLQNENEPKKSRIEDEKSHEEKEIRRKYHYNDHDSRHSESNYNRNDQLRYGDHIPPPPPPPPPSSSSSTLRDRHSINRENVRQEVSNHLGTSRNHENRTYRRHEDNKYEINRHDDDFRHHYSQSRYSDSYRHHDDYFRNHSTHYYGNYRKDESRENLIDGDDETCRIEISSERKVFNSVDSGSHSLNRSNSGSPDQKKASDVPTNGTERSHRAAISYDDL